MAILNEAPGKLTIDLSGPQGNAFALIGLAQDLGKKSDYTKQEITALREDMMSGNYDHLLQVFDQHFGDLVDLLLPPTMMKSPMQEESSQPQNPRSSRSFR